MRTSVLSTVLVVGLVGIACSDDTTAPATGFHATLTGAQEVPAVTSSAAAAATFDIVGTKIRWTINITTAASSNFTKAHIHAGTSSGGATPAGTGSGVVRIDLCGDSKPACPTGTGTVVDSVEFATGSTAVQGSPTMTFDQLVAAMRAFGAYINLHSATNTGGEIRGQLVPDAP